MSQITLKIPQMPKTLAEGKRLLEEDPTLKRIVEVIVEVLDPDAIILFGSRARGDYNEESDYDILVLKGGVKPEERRRLEGRIEVALLKKGVFHTADIVVQSPDRYRFLRTLLGTFYGDITRDGVIIYEKERSKNLD